MSELIRRETTARPAPFSGERLTGAASGQIEIEHYHRYLLAREFCGDKDVLDVAAGEGYGSALLAQVARSVVGVEIDPDTVAAARVEFRRPNLGYEQGDARALPLPDGSIDVAVSFETLEHLAEQDMFLAELHRVLRPGGLVIMSTPDRDIYSPLGSEPNPYHVRELSRAEFEALLLRHFANHVVASQRALIGSLIIAGSESLRCYERRGDKLIERGEHLPRAPYLLALASDGALPPLPNSVYVYRSDIDTDASVRAEAEAALGAEKASSRRVAELQKRLEQRTEAMERRLAAEIKDHAATRRGLDATTRHLQSIQTSPSWQATGALRQAGERYPRLATVAARVLKVTWWTITLQLPDRYRRWRAHRRRQLEEQRSMQIRVSDVRVPFSQEPVVSVIISTYGHLADTLVCLKSLGTHTPRYPIEVIVVDDDYPGPENMNALNDVKNILFRRNVVNMGFLRSCNRAARSAKGRYIYMLNNDTELQSGSIDTLVDLLEARPDVGMVGSKLLYPDGRLQEAGGILWQDASGWNHGRGADPSRPEFNYLREVDFCSGASLMIRRAVFEALGGFDETFAPAYYEDVDLAFRVRAHGLKVLYEPRSVVIHHEGLSHGTDLAVGTKAHQPINQSRMVQRWEKTLEREQFPTNKHLLRARDRARLRKVILIIDHYAPEPDRDAGSRSTMGILDSLLDAGWVIKFWPHNRAYSPIYTTALETRGIEVLDHRTPNDLNAWLREYGHDLDHLLVIRPDIAADTLPSLLRNTDAALSFYGVDLHFERIRRQAEMEDSAKLRRDATQMERLERRLWRHFDLVIYPSAEEAAVVRTLSPQTTVRSIVPFWFDPAPARMKPSNEKSILFVAGFGHPPNVDAALFLIHDIMPLLQDQIGPIKVVLAGSNPTEVVRALAGPDVEVTGYLTDEALKALYNSHRVAIVPLRFGAGVKGKVVEALSHGLPLVTTPIGIQGIAGLEDVVAVRSDAAGIADAVKVLLTNDAAWMAQSHAQTQFAQSHFSRHAMQRSVLAALEAGEAAARIAVATQPPCSSSKAPE